MKRPASRSRIKRSQGILRDFRVRAQLTQTELADRLGKPQSYVSKYENGERRLDFGEIMDVCDALGVSLGAFMRRAEREIRRAR